MVKYTDPDNADEIRELLSSVGVKPDKWCCFLLNDCNDPSAVSGGSHWTLLIHGKILICAYNQLFVFRSISKGSVAIGSDDRHTSSALLARKFNF
jgi:hypothetical protein